MQECTFKEDKPDHMILHVGTNDLAFKNNAERIEKSIVDLAKGLVAAYVNSYLKRMCSNVNVHFIDNARVFNQKRHLNDSTLHLNLKGSVKLSDVFINSAKKCTQFDLPIHKTNLLVIKV